MDEAPLPESSQNEGHQPSRGTPHRFGAGKAFITFLGVNLAQIFVGIGFVVVSVVIVAIRGANLQDPAALRQLTTQSGVLLLLVSPLAAIAATLFFARLWAWDLTQDKSPSGMGVTAVKVRAVVAAGVVGIASAVTYLLFAHFAVPPRPGTPLGPLAALAATSSFARGAWAFLAICLAPPIEEFLFRGMLLKGFASSWGMPASAAVVTMLFVLSHVFETYHYLPAMIGISILAVGTLVFRLSTRSILPAIALHCGYNLAIVFAVPFL
jgi:membrane protease YdiL (CAAX protease family)